MSQPPRCPHWGMSRTIVLILVLCLFFALPARAQDGLNLPADLYVLLNDGRIERYGVGAGGVTTVSPADTFVIDFGVDSTGSRLAYRSDSGAYLLDLTQPGASPTAIEGVSADVPAFRGTGESLAWAPGGDAIAYTTTYGARIFFAGVGAFSDLREALFKQVIWSPGGRFLAAESESEGQSVWWVYRRENTALTLTSIIADGAGAITWLSDSEIVFAPVIGGLRLMQLDQANAQVTLLDAPNLYRMPALDSSDALVFFARDPLDAAVPDGYGTLLRLARGAAQTESVGTVPVEMGDLAWSPGAALLVLLDGGVMALFDPVTGSGFPLPINGAVAYDWGAPRPANDAGTASADTNNVVIAPTGTADMATIVPMLAPTVASSPPTPIPIVTATGLSLSADGYFLAPVQTAENGSIVRVWRLPANGGVPTPVTRNTSDVIEFAVAPDGTVVYIVDAELWAQVGDESPFRLARLNSFAPISPTFSPDGTTVYYADEGTGIWRIALAAARDGEDPELLRARALDSSGAAAESPRRPQSSPDGTKLLLDVYRDDSIASDALDLESRQTAMGGALAAGDLRAARATWLRDGRVVTFVDALSSVAAPPGVYIVTPPTFDGGVLTVPLPTGTVIRAAQEALPGTLRLLLADGVGADAPIRIADALVAGEGAGNLIEVMQVGQLTAPRLSRDGRFVGGTTSSPAGEVLTVIDLLTGARFVISAVAGVGGFMWG
ncbi:MAG: hypothetical protein SGJ24_13435 [Chloroflexota bacterium]|nr:hypothetical protein [Chloroflexota bacterium]